MNPIQLEAWVLRIADQVKNGTAPEDGRVELKAEWPDPVQTARQIAGHANAARGAHILWIVGLDEKRGVVGAGHQELANWYPKIQSRFDGLAPDLFDLNIPVEGKTVTALLFSTDRAPYVVNNPSYGQPGGGPVELEIPWREGRKTRTARRSDLIRLLEPLVASPPIETLSVQVVVIKGESGSGEVTYAWHLNATAYVSPTADTAVVIPFHKCEAQLSNGKGWALIRWNDFRVVPPWKMGVSAGHISSGLDSMTIESSSSEVIIHGPGRIHISANSSDIPRDDLREADLMLSIRMFHVGSFVPIVLQERLQPVSPMGNEKFFAKWTG